jgi:Tfp pilus assembly protein PilZ
MTANTMDQSTIYDIHFESAAQLVDVFEREIQHGGIFVESDAQTTVFESVVVHFHLHEGTRVPVPGQVVNQVNGGFFVQLSAGESFDALGAAIESVKAINPEVADESPVAADAEIPDNSGLRPAMAAGVSRPAWELIDISIDVPLHKQISALSIPEKIKLARFANRPVRRIMIRDNEKRIHMAIVQNPKLSEVEVIEFSRIPTISPSALRWISNQLKFMKLAQVVNNIAVNPATPMDLALKLLSRMSTGELLRLIRSSRVREAIIRGAKRKLAERGAH